jgi:hypothetical protein
LSELLSYFLIRERIDKVLQERIDLMGERMTRATGSEWLFIFGPDESSRDRTPWTAYTIDDFRRLVRLPDDKPFNPFVEFSRGT